MFLNTLKISEKHCRNSIRHLESTGVVTSEKRGGRSDMKKEEDAEKRKSVENHINRFPRTESHYCRNSTTKQYLNSDLNLSRMYQLYGTHCEEHNITKYKASFSLYKNVFGEMNIDFFHPKKDMCGFCKTYYEADNEDKQDMEYQFQEHQKEKKLSREIKNEFKTSDQRDNTLCVATFDLMQTLLLPITNHSSVFYSRRLSMYNEMIYELASKIGTCYTWHEGIAKRGTAEVGSVLYDWLREKDGAGITEIMLFC